MIAAKRAIAPTVAVAAVLAAGCGAGPASTSGAFATTTPAGPTVSTTAPAASAPPEPAAGPVITVTIAAGTVTPTNAEADAVVGQPITLAVSSDAADSIHVHSIPEHTFEVQPLPDQRFEFTVEVPGSVEVELHDLNRTLVTIAVRPQ